MPRLIHLIKQDRALVSTPGLHAFRRKFGQVVSMITGVRPLRATTVPVLVGPTVRALSCQRHIVTNGAIGALNPACLPGQPGQSDEGLTASPARMSHSPWSWARVGMAFRQVHRSATIAAAQALAPRVLCENLDRTAGHGRGPGLDVCRLDRTEVAAREAGIRRDRAGVDTQAVTALRPGTAIVSVVERVRFPGS